MVLKLYTFCGDFECGFENDVKMYGTQTLPSLSTKSP